MENMGIADLKENPLEEEANRMEQDLSEKVDKELPPLEAKARAGQLQTATEEMLLLEKKCRQSGDSDSTIRVAESIVRLSYEAKNMQALCDVLALLAKRRGQFKRVILKIVNVAIEFVSELQAEQDKLQLIDTLRAVTEGKMFVENERARLTRLLANMKEAKGELKQASKLMQELQVETYNTMERKEKTDYILEQMRLCLATHDYARAQIISRKISERLINHADFQEEKERYYRMMVTYYTYSKQNLDICRSYLSIYNTPLVKKDDAKWQQALQKAVVYVCLSRFDNEQNDLSERILTDKALASLPVYKNMLEAFLKKEIMSWPQIQQKHADTLRRDHPEFLENDGELFKVLEKRVVEHNIRIIALYYRQIRLERMAKLINQSRDETERHVSELVNVKMIYAKIDRPQGIVVFREAQNPMDLMENWTSSIQDLLQKIDNVSHQVHRELVIHKVTGAN